MVPPGGMVTILKIDPLPESRLQPVLAAVSGCPSWLRHAGQGSLDSIFVLHGAPQGAW
jgi:hypothetical protein